MKTTKLWVALALLMGTAVTAEAQIGGLLNKAKKVVKETAKEVKETAKEVKDKMPGEAAKQLEGANKTMKAEAGSRIGSSATETAVGQAAVKGGGSFDDLKKDFYPLKPYKNYPTFYALAGDAVAKQLYDAIMRQALSTNPRSSLVLPNVGYDEKQRPEFVLEGGQPFGTYADDLFRYPYAARFMIDPQNKEAFERLGDLLGYCHIQITGVVGTQTDDENNGICDAAKGWLLPTRNYKNMRLMREREAIGLARTATDYGMVADYVTEQFKLADEATDAYQKIKHAMCGLNTYQEVLRHHKGYSASEPRARQAMLAVSRYDKALFNLCAEFRQSSAKAVPLPTGVAVAAEVKSRGEAAGRALAKNRGEEFVQVIFKSKTWQAFKEPQWPHRITVYALPCVLVTKSGGKQWMITCDLQKNPDGSQYNMVVKDGSKVPVK